ncbi:hypothetical protein ACIPXV_17115 [Streptomyces libani]|uniref:hypothetical protein n=1 Tax=Streptomyces nigrescens TaxID=1920 RepID=UPI0038263D9C
MQIKASIRDDTNQLQRKDTGQSLIAGLRAVAPTVIPMHVMHQKIAACLDPRHPIDARALAPMGHRCHIHVGPAAHTLPSGFADAADGHVRDAATQGLYPAPPHPGAHGMTMAATRTIPLPTGTV